MRLREMSALAGRWRRAGVAALLCLQAWCCSPALAEPVAGWTLQADQTIDGTLELGSGTLDLAGYTLTVAGKLVHAGGLLRINGGTLTVRGDYRVETPCTTTAAGYCASDGVLEMTGIRDKIEVGGNFVFSSRNRNSALSAGVLEVKRNFVQLATEGGDGTANFAASGTHVTLLSGSDLQTVFFSSPGKEAAHFAGLVLRNSSTAGVNFLGPVVATVAFVANDVAFTLANPAQSSLPGIAMASGPTLSILGPVVVPSGGNITLAAALTTAGGTASPVTPTWRVTQEAAATISGDGVLSATSVASDTRVLVGASYPVDGTTLTVTRIVTIVTSAPVASPLVSLNVAGPARIQGGGRLSLMAQAIYEDGSTRTVSPTWTSSNPAAIVVSDLGLILAGYVSGETPATMTASYTENGVTVSASLEVTVKPSRAVLAELTLTGPVHMQSGGRAQLQAVAGYDDDSRRPVLPRQWSVSDPALAAVDARGFLKVAPVTQDTPLTVTATHSEGDATVSASLAVTVHPGLANLEQLTIVGARGMLPAGTTLNLLAEGRYADTSRRTVNAQWSVSRPDAASISADGVLTVGDLSTDTPLLIVASYSEGGVTRRAEFHALLRPAAATLQLLAEVEATGETDDYSLALWCNTNLDATTTRTTDETRATRESRATRSTTYNLYVAALVPAGPLAASPTYFMLNRAGAWAAMAWPLAEYLSGIEENSWELVELIDSLDVSLISGTQIFVGYGTSGDEMLAAGRYQLAYQVP